MSGLDALPRFVAAPAETTACETHVVCCDESTAMCSTDMTGACWAADEDPVDCVVCADLFGTPCADPGCPLRGQP